MKFKVGDKVRVRKDLVVGSYYNHAFFISDMKKFKGKIVEIREVFNIAGYYIKGSIYMFGEDMLEPIKFTKSDLKDGDKITFRNGEVGIYTGDETYIDGLCNCHINNDLTNNGSRGSELDIVKVERPKKYKTIYEREKARKMTVKEISEALGYEVEVVDSHE